MDILICNVGSTSLKYRLFRMEKGETALCRGGAERVGGQAGRFYHENLRTGAKWEEAGAFPTHREAIERMLRALTDDCLKSLSDLACVGFKVVHAKGVSGVQYLTDEVLAKMEAFNCVAPAHNPPYLAAIRQFRALLPETPLIGSFETGFHRTIPPEAALYGIPLEVSRKYEIRRYGFHGASLQYLSEWTAARLGKEQYRLVACHLGGSGSVCAVKDGKSVDTSMGLSLQCGLLQNNRCGDLDPYVIFYLVEECGMTLGEVRTMLETKSGLLGLSGGLSNDLRDLEKAAREGNKDAAVAVRAYAYSVKKYIGAYAAALGGLDAVAFGGGIGCNSAAVRAMALDGLAFLGAELDAEKNERAKPGDDISAAASRARIFVVDTDEEIIVARKARTLLERA
jgi:acetate kinase